MDKEKSTPIHATRPFKIASLSSVFILICILFMVAFSGFQPDQKSLSDLYFPSPTATFTLTPTPTLTPTSTPSPTPTPYAYLTPPAGIVVHKETFDLNTKGWDAYYKNNTTRVENGKLILTSNERGQEGMALCYECGYSTEKFYFQAELLPEKPIAIRYGISFCASENNNEYYVFALDEVFSLYTLYKHSPAGQQNLIKNERTDIINRYPLSNIMGIRFDNGTMELYLNNQRINAYTDDNHLPCEWQGVFMENGIFDLLVDNVFAYSLK